jgi:predicted ATPase/DNA-binding winged helix-turn-helix (wHTH) protein/predicted negative regulator of RcsB-dependent stress response
MTLRFETFSIDPADRKLLVHGQEVLVGARAFDVLWVLAQRYGQVVSKQTLLAQAWHGLVVEENNLQVQIAGLRKILGKSLIRTVSGRGYCLTVAALAQDDSPEPVRPQTLPLQIQAKGLGESRVLGEQGHLPNFIPRLFGRDKEVAELGELLQAHRLVTLTGAGGMGKTHLATSVGLIQKTQWRDGVWLLRAEECHGLNSLLTACMQTLGVVDGQDLNVSDALNVVSRCLQGKQLLVIVDNCEHVLEPVQTLLRVLLGSVAGLHVLATSQVPLRMPNEFIYQLDTLAIPSEGDSLEQALQCASVQMFLARLQQFHQKYSHLNADELRCVVLICQRLDGLALALLLAAARVPLLGLRAVSEHVSQCLDVLASNKLSLELPERHQALKEVMNWAYRLLSPPEARAFARLGLLVGSFDLETAQHVLGDPGVPHWQVFNWLESLLGHGFLVVTDGGEKRYRLLQPHRLFALEKLQESGELEVAKAGFARSMLDLSDALIKVRKTDALWADLPNILVAFEWACEQEDEACHALAMALAVNTAMLLLVAGRAGMALQHLLRVSPWVHLQPSQWRVAKYWQWLGRCGVHGRLPTSRCIESFERAHHIYVELGQSRHAHACKRMLAEAHMDAGNVQCAEESLRDAMQLEGPHTTMADSMRRLRLQGLLAQKNGDTNTALDWLQEALLLAKMADIPRYAVTIELDIARLYIAMGNLEKSLSILDHLQQTGVRHFSQQLTLGSAFADLMFALLQLGEWERAAQICALGLPHWESSGVFARYGDLLAWWLLAGGEKKSESQAERVLCAQQLLSMANRFFTDSEVRRDYLAQHSHDQVVQLLRSSPQITATEKGLSSGNSPLLSQGRLIQYLESRAQSANFKTATVQAVSQMS